VQTSPSTPSPAVFAIVLTHDAPESLRSCVERIAGQLAGDDRLLVVDNASRIPASEVLSSGGLSSDRVEFLRLEDNLGPAGGYARALARFLESSHGFAWIVDDDMLAEPGALAALKRAVLTAGGTAVAFPSVVDPTGKEWTQWAWCGVLIPRAVVEAVGVPREDFFWWLEDTEYLQWRIPRAGFRCVRVAEAKVMHGAVRRGKTKPAWKYYYEVRNTVFFRLFVQLPGGFPGRSKAFTAWRMARRVVRTTLKSTARIALVEDEKLLKMSALARGVRDGLAQRIGARYTGRGAPAGATRAPK
jgi:rhamnopyranosyl-N-acetylglucosaminyl-diphospho-decaprenol beta-1,3/1,4-galactofuranosyltransferase